MRHVPRISNLNFFNEATLDIAEVFNEVEKKISTRIDKHGYEVFSRNKFRKPIFDLYALFSPFNEANKAFYPFIPYLKNKLKKGDVILDFGNRTGWSTAMLSALFPEQRIICIWEGDTDVLGYGGFAYWFDNEPSNIEIFFCGKNEPLPFEDNSIAFVYGLDVLHRQLKTDLINELVRIVYEDALVVFPHVHLANSQPEPFFKRGGDLIHGLAYEKFFGKLKNKKGYIFSEPDLFRASYSKAHKAKANANTSDYNGLAVIANKDFDLEKELSIFNYFDYFGLNEGYLLPNPIFEVDVNNSIKTRTSQIESQFTQLLHHHPVYIERIKDSIGYSLTNEELITIYWAKRCRSCSFIQNQLKIDDDAFKQLIENLQEKDILQIMPLNPKYVRMQHYFAYQEFTEAPENLHLRHLWKRAVKTYPENTYVSDRNDNTFYTYTEFNEIVKYITSTLIQNNISKGDKIILHADINFEAIGLFWACMHLGVVFIPVSSSLADIVTEGILEQHHPKAIFLSHDVAFHKKWGDKIIFFDKDPDSALPDKLYFSEWLNDSQEIDDLPDIDENDLGAILHTSGSTGVPKGVKLTHGQLFESVINLIRTYLWTEKDNYLATNDLDSITGFRSACITTVEAGATCVIPSSTEKNNPAELLACIYETETTRLSTGPSLLNQFLSKKDVKTRFAKVKNIISAGSALTTHLKTEFFEKTNKRITNVYGLTETSGISIGEPLNSDSLDGNFIGYPVDCLVKIIDENDNDVKIGEIGELLLYGYTTFKGYYSDNEPNAHHVQQWFATGDLVKMNPDGSIELTGRKKDFMKNSRGEIVYFIEIEDALSRVSFVKDLGLIAFFQDESERAALFLELNTTGEEPKNMVEEIKKHLAATVGVNKIPSVIKVIDKIPRSAYGKLLKTELKQYI